MCTPRVPFCIKTHIKHIVLDVPNKVNAVVLRFDIINSFASKSDQFQYEELGFS